MQFKILVATAGAYVASILNFVSGYLALLLLGPEKIGLFQSYLLIKNYALHANLGEVEAIRKVGAVLAAANESSQLDEYQRQTFSVATITVAGLSLALALVGKSLLGLAGIRWLTLMTVLGLLVSEYLIYFFGNYLRALNRFEIWSKATVLLSVASLASLGLIIPLGYRGFLLGRIAASLLCLGYLVRVLKYQFRFTLRLTKLRDIVAIGVPMSVVALLLTFLQTADRLVVVYLLDDVQVGFYSITAMIGLPILLFVQAASSVLFTRSSQLLGRRSETEHIVADTLQFVRSTDRFLPHLIYLLLFLLPLLVAKLLPQYSPGVRAAQLALIGYSFYAASSPSANLFIVLGRQRVLSAVLAACGLSICLLAAFAVRSGAGLQGVGAATAIGYAGFAMLCFYFPLRFAGHRPWLAFREACRLLRKNLCLAVIGGSLVLISDYLPISPMLSNTFLALLIMIWSMPTLVHAARQVLQHIKSAPPGQLEDNLPQPL